MRFDDSKSCPDFLSNLRWKSTIAYGYSLSETVKARLMVECLASDEALSARTSIRQIHIRAPVIGRPEPGQKAFFDLIQILPNLEIVKYALPFNRSYTPFADLRYR